MATGLAASGIQASLHCMNLSSLKMVADVSVQCTGILVFVRYLFETANDCFLISPVRAVNFFLIIYFSSSSSLILAVFQVSPCLQ